MIRQNYQYEKIVTTKRHGNKCVINSSCTSITMSFDHVSTTFCTSLENNIMVCLVLSGCQSP